MLDHITYSFNSVQWRQTRSRNLCGIYAHLTELNFDLIEENTFAQE